MIPENIKKLITIQETGDYARPRKDDVRIGMELLKNKHPKIPRKISNYLYYMVRADIVEEYCEYYDNESYKWIEK